MNLLVIRHAIAEDKELFALTGRSDDLRPLTAEGRSKMRRASKGLRELVSAPGLVATSPLVRARETAEIVAAAFGVTRIETVDALRPESSYDDLVAWLGTRSAEDGQLTALVGHEPHLGGLVTWLMTGSAQSRVELKKGAACLLAFDGAPSRGEGTLRWLATPSVLRSLAG